MTDLVTLTNKEGKSIRVSREEAARRGAKLKPKGEQREAPGAFMSGVTGFNTAFDRLAQGILRPVLGGTQGFEDVVSRRDQDYARAKEAHPLATGIGEISGEIGSSLPFFSGAGTAIASRLAPKAISSFQRGAPLLSRMTASAGGGGLYGGAQDVTDDESRLKNALIGGTAGAIAEPLGDILGGMFKGGYKGLRRLFGNENQVSKDIFQGLLPSEMQPALEAQEAAQKLGINLSPAEASGNPLLAETEGTLGSTKTGREKYYEHKKGRQEKEDEIIGDFLKSVSPEEKVANEEARSLAQKIIQNKKEARQKRAHPYYESSKSQEIDASTLKKLTNNGVIEDALNSVIKDSKYRTEIEGVPVNSIKVLDIVKKRIDGLMNAAKAANNTDDVRLYRNAKESLVKELDKVSKDYKKARRIYAEDSPAIEKIENSEIGKIANLQDTQLQGLTKRIFDREETDPRVLAKIRDEMSKEDPKLWRNLIKNEMTRRLDTANLAATEAHGSNFYNKILKQDKDFNQFVDALKGDDKAIQALYDMRKVFKDLINKRTVKGQAGKSETGMLQKRNTIDAAKEMILRLNEGAYDNAAVEMITSDKWATKLREALNKPAGERDRQFLKLLNDLNAKKYPTQLFVSEKTKTEGRPFLETENYQVYE